MPMNIDRPRVRLAHLPTPLEPMPNLSRRHRAFVKRDDCTGLAMGGNKVRQLEYYLGDARAQGCDTILITGAVQSNYVRCAAAAARKLGMDCHIQLEQRVARKDGAYRNSGNVLLDRLLGATLHHYPQGEDEQGADRELESLAQRLRAQGSNPYVIPLSPQHPPLGALGYIHAAEEILRQAEEKELEFEEMIVPSGSGITHAGLLYGLRAQGCRARVIGICVRRCAELQRQRIARHCQAISILLKSTSPVTAEDIVLTEEFLAPGYGCLNEATRQAISVAARCEGLLVDPVYSGKALAGFIQRLESSAPGAALLFIHTGGTPALFAYGDAILNAAGVHE